MERIPTGGQTGTGTPESERRKEKEIQMNAFFEEIKENEQEQEGLTGKYRKLAALTDRLVEEMTRDFAVEFTPRTGRPYDLALIHI